MVTKRKQSFFKILHKNGYNCHGHFYKSKTKTRKSVISDEDLSKEMR